MTESAAPQPMPFDLWWSPSMRRFLSRHENQDDEHLVWVFHGQHEALRNYLGTGADSNPPLPNAAVRLVLADPEQGSELERLRDEAATLRELNVGWVAYRDRKTAERKRHVEEFEDALGPEHAGGGYWYERMIAAARKVRAERDQLAWLHAELVHKYAALLAQRDQWWEVVAKQRGDVERERDQLQSRLDAVDAALDYPTHAGGLLDRVRAALAKPAAPILPGDETPQPEEDQ